MLISKEEYAIINKVAKIYHYKFNMSRYGYELDDSKSVAVEVFIKCSKSHKGLNNASFATFFEKCISNAFRKIVRYMGQDLMFRNPICDIEQIEV